MEKEPNILFIIIDALRAKNLGCYGYAGKTSQNIDALASDAILFENAFSCSNVTDPSLTTIFSGKYPRSHGIINHGEGVRKEQIQRFHESETILLPEILKSKGYVTLAVDWLGRWHKRGYDFYSGIPAQRKTKPLYSLMVESMNKIKPMYSLIRRLFALSKVPLIENAKVITDKAIELVKKIHDRKFFLFIHYWDTHAPYNPPPNYVKRFINYNYPHNQSIAEILNQFDARHVNHICSRLPNGVTSTHEILARYDGAIAIVDNEIKRLIETLEEYGIFDQTITVLTSDHGESLTEHGIFFDHHGLYDETIHVPLFFRHPLLFGRMKNKGLIQHTDVVPTILDVLDIDLQRFGFDGKSALPLIRDETMQVRSAVYSEELDREQKRAIRTKRHKYILAQSEKDALCKSCGFVHGGVEELYDLDADPLETQNIIGDNSGEAEKLRRSLFKWANSFEGGEVALREDELEKSMYSEENEKDIRERLKKLGYA